MPLTRTPASTRSRSHVNLGAVKYGSSGRPVIARKRAAEAPRRLVTTDARRSCHEIAGWTASPPARQATAVSPWFAMPTACTGDDAAANAARPALTMDESNSSGSCCTPPLPTGVGCTGTSASERTSPLSLTTRAFVDEVPWSMARTLKLTSGL